MIKIALNESNRTVAQYMKIALEAGVAADKMEMQERILRVLDKAKYLILDGDAERIYEALFEQGMKEIKAGRQSPEGVKGFVRIVIQKAMTLFAVEEIRAGREKKPHRKISPAIVEASWKYCAENWQEVRSGCVREFNARQTLNMPWKGRIQVVNNLE